MSQVREHEIGTLTLSGVTYRYKTPKIGGLMSAMVKMRGKTELEQTMILVEAQAKWLRSAIGQEAWEDVDRRLNDDDDPLDWPEISAIFEQRIAEAGDRPFTSSSGSSGQSLETMSSEVEPKPQVSIFGT